MFFHQNGVFNVLNFCNRLRVDIIVDRQAEEIPGDPGFCLPECMGGAKLFFLDDHFDGQVDWFRNRVTCSLRYPTTTIMSRMPFFMAHRIVYSMMGRFPPGSSLLACST